MPKQLVTIRTTAGEEQQLYIYQPLPSQITLRVTAARHNTGINSNVDAERAVFGPEKTFTWSEANQRYEEV